MNGSSKRKKYFPNNWKRYKDAPAELFEQHLFLDVMDWKISGWMLPPDVCCIIRATHLKTKKVKEFVYKQQKSADKKLMKFLTIKTHELCVTTHEAQHYIVPDPFDALDDEPFDF